MSTCKCFANVKENNKFCHNCGSQVITKDDLDLNYDMKMEQYKTEIKEHEDKIAQIKIEMNDLRKIKYDLLME